MDIFNDEYNERFRKHLKAEQKQVEQNRLIFAYFSMSVLDFWEHCTMDKESKEIVFIGSKVTTRSFINHLLKNRPVKEFEERYPEICTTSLEVLGKSFNPKGDCDNDLIGKLQQKSLPEASAENINQFIELRNYIKTTDDRNDILDLTSKAMLQFLKNLNQATSYLIVGGLAVNHHGHIRITQNLDVWCSRPQDIAFIEIPENVNMFFDMSTLGMRHFWGCYYRSEEIDFNGIRLRFIGIEDLLVEKRGRNSIIDQSDIKLLT
ncbi:MAG: DUF6036 family nucleotidyltransferase [Reichenbachiella sp.]|uniref:DUF6036 family nucleotidyltransferase n=1 Tax=Reichenbachiella sp. TaxID=2184521 RepID=UPI003299CDA5